MSRPTPKQIAWELDGPKASHPAERLLDALREHGYVIVHPDDVDTNRRAPEGLFGSTYDEAYEFGWNACRDHIFAAAVVKEQTP